MDATQTARPTAEIFTPAQVARFQKLLDLEHQTQITKNVAGFIVGNGQAAQKREQEKLFAEVSALTPAEAAAFGRYRAAHR